MRSSILLLFATFYAFAQTTPCFTFEEDEFSISGHALIINDDTVRLTQAQNWQSGFIWSQNLINFDLDFSLEVELYFGTQDSNGADGIAFVIQPLSNDEGSNGGGIGYEGISPSLAIEFDTWWNSGADPTEMDHVALVANGLTQNISAHSSYAPFVGVSNLEDGQWHPLSIQWNANDQTLSVELDGQIVIFTTIDIINTFFSGNTGLFWGFTSATGGANNLHQVKILEYCSVDSSCNTPPPTADSPQTFCASTTLDQLQINGANIRFYSEESGDTLLNDDIVLIEDTTVYMTQTIDDCESQDLVAVEILIENPTIYSDSIEIEYCTGYNTVSLYGNEVLFLSPNFSGFFNTQFDLENLINSIDDPNHFVITTENQMVYARLEDGVCYEVYPIELIPKNCDVIIPQAISPNEDGFNDVFEIQNLYDVHLNHQLKIYNRYGECIFEGNNNKKWAGLSDKGKLIPVGTYFYVLHLNNENKEVFTGWVYCNY